MALPEGGGPADLLLFGFRGARDLDGFREGDVIGLLPPTSEIERAPLLAALLDAAVDVLRAGGRLASSGAPGATRASSQTSLPSRRSGTDFRTMRARA